MEKVFRLHMSDQLTPDGFGQRHKPMEARLAQLQEERPKLEEAIDFLKVNMLSREQILDEAKSLASYWPTMPSESKRRVVENLVERITFGPREIQIDLCYLPTHHSPLVRSSDSDDSNDSAYDASNDDNDDPKTCNLNNIKIFRLF